jgi:hypothetical protein
MAHSIQYLRNDEIDKQRWDLCIDAAANARPYACSVYLDHMADNWDGLVSNNYEAVMPLPWKKKWGIHYIYQPFLTAQLGLFGNDVNPQLLEAFLDAIPQKFRLWEFPLNQSNRFAISYPLYDRVNYVLDLNRPYEDLYKGYRENIRRNIKKSQQYGCRTESSINIEQIIAVAKDQGAGHDQDFLNFEKLFHHFLQQGKAKTYGILSDNNELLASAAFIFWHKRAYYILVGNHPNGRTLGASHALIDAFIKDHTGQDLLLDFEGSDIRNLAFFYSSFGAKEEIYPAIRRNKLPWYVKLFRK